MQERIPLVYFFGIDVGKYVAAWPVFVVADDPAAKRFTVALDDVSHAGPGLALTTADGVAHGADSAAPDEAATARRQYITSTFQRRLHQSAFRERVLSAYRSQCALCHLRHQELLDAAHIIPDTEPDGEPVVPNGLALCKLHHAAYDRNFLTVTSGYVIEVRRAILEEDDGPMLLHGLKEMHGKEIRVPREREKQPDRERLERRWKRFREAG
jgi:putative restriction endonuclease